MNISQLTAIVATALSVICLSYLAYRKHDPAQPRTMSELATLSNRAMLYFRLVLFVCGTLFAVSMYGYVIARINFASWHAVAWTLTYVSELLLALLPATGKTNKAHTLFAYTMATGMLGTSWGMVASLKDMYRIAALGTALLASTCALLTVLDSKRFVMYELGFLYMAHAGILIGVAGV